LTIVNSTLELNTRDGIALVEGGAARIGVLRGDSAAASPNIIQSNGRRGVTVTRSSTARIVGNTIQNNTEDGVHVSRVSHADISNNIINGNGGDGIFVSENSGVNLGNNTGTTIFDLPNSTTVNNAGVGIGCDSNSYASGRLGSLNGALGQSGFAPSCVTSLTP
jgi:parallel beta-helix repeat protein